MLEAKYWNYLDTEDEGGKWRRLEKHDPKITEKDYLIVKQNLLISWR